MDFYVESQARGETSLSLFLSSLYLLQGSSEAVLGTDQVSFFPVLLP